MYLRYGSSRFMDHVDAPTWRRSSSLIELVGELRFSNLEMEVAVATIPTFPTLWTVSFVQLIDHIRTKSLIWEKEVEPR